MKRLSIFVLVLFSLFFNVSCGEIPDYTYVGEAPPDFSLVDLDGKTWTLSELKGKVVFVNFWATWCPPCRDEMPSMQNLYTTLPKDKFVMLAILNKDEPQLARNFASKLGLTMPILNDQANKVGSKYGLTGLPETFIVDKGGILREKIIGPAKWDSPQNVQMLKKYINQ